MERKTKKIFRAIEEGGVIDIDRELREIIYDNNTVKIKVLYNICGEAWIPAIERELYERLNIYMHIEANKFNSELKESILYTISVPFKELEKAAEIIREYDGHVINTIEELIKTAKIIAEFVNKHF